MLKSNKFNIGFAIDDIAICDFDSLKKITNDDILEMSRGAQSKKLLSFISRKMGITNRYWAENIDSFDLAKQVLNKLIKKNPSILDEAEFLIFGGISNPMPTVCIAALLACEFEFKNTSCWDLKSGCSTGVLALQQAVSCFEKGAKKGVIICSETFSKFTDIENLQMAASIGDGASGIIISADENSQVLGTVHGTDASYFKTMYVPGRYPVDIKNYNASDYVFHFAEKADAIEKIGHYWNQSLADLLETSTLKGEEINHYIAHQVDGSKNLAIAKNAQIPEKAIALNFNEYGNMGCPTIFINLFFWLQTNEFKEQDNIIFHAVGGGLSWAGLSLKKK